MRVRAGNWLWGLCIVAFGVLWLLSEVKVLDFNIFFPGWWTLFIIIPCLISMVQMGINTGNVMGLGIGVVLLLARNDIVSYSIILPLIVVVIGLSLLFKKSFPTHTAGVWNPPAPANKDGRSESTAVFSGNTTRPEGERYTGGEATAVFGGVKLDLRHAIIDQDIQIECSSVFGGIEVFVPDYCRIIVKGTNIFGGVSDQRKSPQPTTGPIIYLEATCVFGGVTLY